MASLNKVMLIGNLGKDPEVRFTAGGKAVANFSIATTERRKNKDTGNYDDKTEWHNIVVWDKLAELCREYLRKGRQVYVEGQLQTRSWDDKEGKKRYTTEVVASNIVFLGSRGESAGAAPGFSGGSQGSSAPSDNGPPAFDESDDIPF